MFGSSPLKPLARLAPLVCLLPGLLLGLPAPARAENTLQLWTNFMLEWQVSQRNFLAFDLEPKVLLVGEGQWRNFDFTPTYEFAPTRWLDLIGEMVVGYTNDTVNPDATEVTERLGARFYIWRKQLQIRDMFRFEQRNRFFSDDTSDAVFRWRNRVELRYAFNRQRTTEAGAVTGLLDWEIFVPIDQDVHERYASRHRLRAGVGYRPVVAWRIDLIYLVQRSRNTIDEPFDNIDHVIDIRVRRAL
jgi:hypothetical protein